MVRKRCQRRAVDDDFRVAQLGLAGVAQVERHDLRFGDAVQHGLRQLEPAQVAAQAREPVRGRVTAHGKARIGQQTFGRQICGNSAAHKTGRAGQQNTHARKLEIFEVRSERPTRLPITASVPHVRTRNADGARKS
jgi:hypothetical protein